MSDGPLGGDEHLRDDVNIPEDAAEEDGLTAESGPVLSNAAQHTPVIGSPTGSGGSGSGRSTASAEES